MQLDIVVVPDLAAVDLTALVEKELKLTYLESDYKRWDYYRGVDGKEIPGRGRKYEVFFFQPKSGEAVSSEAVRNYFKDLGGFYGHAGAFTQWCRVCGLHGYYATVLEDSDCYRDVSGGLGVPCSRFEVKHRELNMHWSAAGWRGGRSLVGFRELA
ncbi:MAG: hypothetical protein WCW31_02555 [Patescibacteria group bacterium]|jgi:hypothetical protein